MWKALESIIIRLPARQMANGCTDTTGLRSLAWLAMHPLWGVIALPLRAMLYVRERGIPKLNEKHGRTYQTKNELAVELLRWFQRT